MEVGNKSLIVQAIAAAEKTTEGQIKVHLTQKFWDPDPLKSAKKVFFKLGLQNTKGRNAVLLYINLKKRKFAIFGDQEIHKKVGQEFWQKIVAELAVHLATVPMDKAISMTVNSIGQVLTQFFPLLDDQIKQNEISDDLSLDQ